jgi:hypothetical protein
MNNDNYYDHDYTAGNDNTDHTPWDEHPDMKGILRAIENAGLMTEDISNLSRYSLQSQMKNYANFTKVGLTTADKVRHSITDEDHFPYTRKYRGEIVSDDPIIMDRLAGFRPRQDAAYAATGVSTGIANITGSVGEVCGAPLHKNSLGVGASSEGNFDNDPSAGNSIMDPLPKPDYSSAVGVEPFTLFSTPSPGLTAAAGRLNAQYPNSYPKTTTIAGKGRYQRVSHESVGGRSAYPRMKFQASCKSCNFTSR